MENSIKADEEKRQRENSSATIHMTIEQRGETVDMKDLHVVEIDNKSPNTGLTKIAPMNKVEMGQMFMSGDHAVLINQRQS